MPYESVSLGSRTLVSLQCMPETEREIDAFFPDSTHGELLALQAEYPEYFAVRPNVHRFTLNCWLLDGDGPTTMIDTGIDVDAEGARMLSSLEEAGWSPEEVERVVLTHWHGDHVGGVTRQGKPLFPNARYVMARTEFEFFQSQTSLEEQFQKSILPLLGANVLDVVDNDGEPIPGLRYVSTFGHTPGASSVLVDDQALILADTWHFPFQLAHPDWTMKFDSDKATAAETRAKTMQLAAEKGWIVAVPHTIRGGLGRIALSENRFSWTRV